MSAMVSRVQVGDRYEHKLLHRMVSVVEVHPQLRFDIVVEDEAGNRSATHVWNLNPDRRG